MGTMKDDVKTVVPENPQEGIASPPPPMEEKNNSRRFWMISLAIFFILIGSGLFLIWMFVWQFEESTNDAYVGGNIIHLSSQISAPISKIFTDDTDLVEEGQLLILLDDTVTKVNLEQAKATLGLNVRQVAQLFSNVSQLQANVEVQKSQLELAKLDYERRESLINTKGVSLEDLQTNRSRFNVAKSNLIYAQAQLEAAIAQVQGTTIETHPSVEQAKAGVRSAFINQYRTQVFSPAIGFIAKRSGQVGQWVDPGSALLGIVPLFDIWVDANFKETQLKHMRIGQPVKLVADMYGGDVIYHGKVVGLTPGSGDVFNILPPQNATGNWIKIVQRVPVRVSLDPQELLEHPLVLGLSMNVTVDTTDRSGKRLSEVARKEVRYSTFIFEQQGIKAEPLIEEIVQKNRVHHAHD